ncbi:hypothetical protein OIU83_20500 [Flavobacterium sp. LS1R49]|uniref:Uncharacterized protein n=1 Tax=Flavobacterium shii TaxID=2987687 RepID=A0A9X2ZLX1_9FLAO|nr:hypothetical protein [Flavobacterium shii]MCV9930053.1 hypothetical protein [Flavobacterium shii]
MLKNILKLEGTQELTKKEQKSINGAGACPTGTVTICCPDTGCVCAPKGSSCMV